MSKEYSRTNTPPSNLRLIVWGEKKKDPLTENLKEEERGNWKKKKKDIKGGLKIGSCSCIKTSLRINKI